MSLLDLNVRGKYGSGSGGKGGKSAAYREQEYHAGQGGDPLLQRLSQISFSLDEEASLSVSTVTARVKNALDVEKVTRRFYDRFRKELSAFSTFIEGIAVEANRDWYASSCSTA